MITCTNFANTIITGDPYFPPVLWYRDDPGADPADVRTRQQAPYPLNGITYNDSYHNLVTTGYAFEIVPGSLVVTLGPDYYHVDNTDPIPFPATEAQIVMPISLNPDKTLINYFSGWTNSQPYNLQNPPVIPSASFSSGIFNYWNSCTSVHSNVIDVINTPSESYMNVTKNLNPLNSIQTYMDTNSIGTQQHELLCSEIKTRVLECTWDFTEVHPDPDYSDPQALPDPIVDNLDTSVSISYSVRLKEI